MRVLKEVGMKRMNLAGLGLAVSLALLGAGAAEAEERDRPRRTRVYTAHRPVVVERTVVYEAPPPGYYSPLVHVAVPWPLVSAHVGLPRVHADIPGVEVVHPRRVVVEEYHGHVVAEERYGHGHEHGKYKKHKKWKGRD